MLPVKTDTGRSRSHVVARNVISFFDHRSADSIVFSGDPNSDGIGHGGETVERQPDQVAYYRCGVCRREDTCTIGCRVSCRYIVPDQYIFGAVAHVNAVASVRYRRRSIAAYAHEVPLDFRTRSRGKVDIYAVVTIAPNDVSLKGSDSADPGVW